MIRIAPSILNADFSQIGSQIEILEQAGADLLHLDVMDGRFVPNLTFGPPVVKSLRRWTRLPFDVHLMVQEPERFLEPFAQAGANILTVHAEACPHLHRIIQSIKALGLRAGVALNPATPLQVLDYVLEDLDQVLIMTVNPGWGGQSFIRSMIGKIAALRELLIARDLLAEIQVDGGINLETMKPVVEAGATSLVVGSALFNDGELAASVGRYRREADRLSGEVVEG